MDVRAPQHQNETTTCPFCSGTGSVRETCMDGPIKILTYVCESCRRSWNGMERWADRTGHSTEPPMFSDQNK